MATYKALPGKAQMTLPMDLTTEETDSTEGVNHQRHEKHEVEFALPAAFDLESLQSAEGRKALIAPWLATWLEQLGSSAFSVQEFMEAAQQRIQELAEDDLQDWGVPEYEELKRQLFAALAEGRLHQDYDEANNRIQLKTATS